MEIQKKLMNQIEQWYFIKFWNLHQRILNIYFFNMPQQIWTNDILIDYLKFTFPKFKASCHFEFNTHIYDPNYLISNHVITNTKPTIPCIPNNLFPTYITMYCTHQPTIPHSPCSHTNNICYFNIQHPIFPSIYVQIFDDPITPIN
jgi:hypothetical protein